jgi:ubiquinone/menaquinone biosynthesis C-methylase UbiE
MSQFARPTGKLGRLFGVLMALTNKERSWFVLPLLDIHENDRVLEIGFGPGVDIQRVSEMAVGGFVAGVDHSEVMLDQARKRNAAAIRAGRVELRLGPASPLPYTDNSFDKIFSINVAQFWDESVEVLVELQRVLRPGGLIATAVQPRSNDQPARMTGRKLVEDHRAAGFSEIRLESKRMKPAPTVCAICTK